VVQVQTPTITAKQLEELQREMEELELYNAARVKPVTLKEYMPPELLSDVEGSDDAVEELESENKPIIVGTCNMVHVIPASSSDEELHFPEKLSMPKSII